MINWDNCRGGQKTMTKKIPMEVLKTKRIAQIKAMINRHNAKIKNCKGMVSLYLRVSTEDQAREGHSLDEQLERLLKLCEYKDYKIYYIYEDAGISAKNTDRPDFRDMMSDMKAGLFNRIIIYKLDRLTRSIQDLEKICLELEEHNCSLESACEEINTSTANGKFFIRMLTILAQLEIERTSERTKVGVYAAIKKGHLTSNPLGFIRDGKKCVPDEKLTAPIVREIFRLYIEGKNQRQITDAILDTFNYNIRYTAIEVILKNRIYTGDHETTLTDDGSIEILEGVVDPIISKETWELAQKMVNKSRDLRANKITYLFRNKIRCPECGNMIGGSASSGCRGKKVFNYYKCGRCGKLPHINERKVELEVIKQISELIDYGRLTDSSMISVHNQPNYCGKGKEYQENLNNLILKKARIMETYYDGIIDNNEMKNQVTIVDAEIKTNTAKLKKQEIKDVRITEEMDINLYATTLELKKRKDADYNLKTIEAWDMLDDENKALVIADFIEDIDIQIIKHPEEKVLSKRNEIIVKNINIREHKIAGMVDQFREKLMDAVVKVKGRNVLVSNARTEEEIETFKKNLSKHYNFNAIELINDQIDLTTLDTKNIVRIIPNADADEIRKYVIIMT